jgi:hypothetical protein
MSSSEPDLQTILDNIPSLHREENQWWTWNLIDTDFYCSMFWVEKRLVEFYGRSSILRWGKLREGDDQIIYACTFEEVLDAASPSAKEELLFHLDLFA